MKAVVLLIFSLFLCLEVYSAPCYGTKMPDKHQWFWGAETNFLNRRNLHNDLGHFSSTQFFLTGSFGVTDWLCLDGAAGRGSIRYNPAVNMEIDYDAAFAGKYGFRVKVYDKEDIPLKSVFGFQHISVHPHHAVVNNVKRRVIFDDWQFSLLVSYDGLKKLGPYLGAKVSRGDLIEWLDGDRTRRKSKESEMLGVVFGLSFFMNEDFWINLEGRCLGEEAASFGMTYSF